MARSYKKFPGFKSRNTDWNKKMNRRYRRAVKVMVHKGIYDLLPNIREYKDPWCSPCDGITTWVALLSPQYCKDNVVEGWDWKRK